MSESRDDLFAERLERIADFRFDEHVARVFPDMIGRSVPGYSSILASIELLAREYTLDDTRCYDLGCSLGAATLAMRRGIGNRACSIVAIDNAPAMAAGCKKSVTDDSNSAPVDVVCSDIFSVEINNASMVVLNFTLQFVPPELRSTLIQRIHDGLVPGGLLLLSEKLAFEDPVIDRLQITMHHSFKRANGYSELEISQKRNALENVMVPESLGVHRERLSRAGFSSAELWFQCFNFASLVAIK